VRGTRNAEGYRTLKDKADIWVFCGDDRVVANTCGFNR
jgi:hypothetical protein